MKKFIALVLAIAVIASMGVIFSFAEAEMNIDFSYCTATLRDGNPAWTNSQEARLYLGVQDSYGYVSDPMRNAATPRRDVTNTAQSYNKTTGWNTETYIGEFDDSVVLQYAAPFWYITDQWYGTGANAGGLMRLGNISEGSINGVILNSEVAFGNNPSGLDPVDNSGFGFTFVPGNNTAVRLFVFHADATMCYADFETGIDLTASYNDIAICRTATGAILSFNDKILGELVLNGTNATIKDAFGVTKATTDNANYESGTGRIVFRATGESTVYYQTMRYTMAGAPTEAYEIPATTLDTAQVDVFSKKVTVNVRLDLAESATNDDYTVVINGTEATLVNGTFISAPIDLNNIADEFDIELYDGEDLIDSVEGYSVKAYLESLDNKVCADVLALGSALDVYTGGEGFAVEGASAALEVAPTAPAKTAARDSADDYIKGATLLIDEDINIAFTLKTTNATSVVISADGFDDKIVDDIADKYVLTDDIALADLATVFRADLMAEDTGVAYATYSALNYICKNYNNADAKLAAVCQALYAVYADLNVPEG